jgi:hypothetical protein
MTAAQILARRAARIAFGLALLAGMAFNVLEARRAQRWETARGFCVMWLGAVAAAAVTNVLIRWWKPVPQGDALLRASLVVPALGLAFALPLSIHLLFLTLIDGDVAHFGEWVGVSTWVVGFAHVVFALLFAVRARGLAESERPRMSVVAIYGWTVVASALPLGPLIIPEALTAITGLAVLPFMYAFDQIAARERAALPCMPRAIVASWPAHR